MSAAAEQAKSIFLRAVEIAGAERGAYLDSACGANTALRREVEELLGHHSGLGSFLETPAVESDTGGYVPGTVREAVEGPGTVIGPYKLLEQLGEGGMGTVWMAQQTEPVKRLVALKLIKAGMDSRQVIARFEAERQALALMDHPNIAKVLDAGTTPTGRPYFVMELVKGVPLTHYCDEHRLTPRQRLELFIPVCQAIQHAHQKGIIHRDIKPSNVLVALYDGKAVPRVIDFGVAKAAGQSLTDKTLVTGFGNIVGTLEYMSPGQAEVNQLDIDTRSDIYSLGVLLYELLAGSPPFTRKELEKAGMLEMLRVIREQEPTKPSTRLSTTEGLPTLAANRGTEPAKLTKLVRGELDWIVMKALEKDRNRRYESANGFAMDIQRYLADEPVLACPPSTWYRLGKFARRNRSRLAMASVVAVALLFVVSISAASVGWALRDQQVRQEAVEQEASQALNQAEAGCRAGRWPEAEAEVKRARTLLGKGGGLALRSRLERLEADVQLGVRLEEIHLSRADVVKDNLFDQAGAAAAYTRAFREYGLPVLEGQLDEAVGRIQTSAIREALLAALDDWAGTQRESSPHWTRLLSVAQAADDNHGRRRCRAALLRQDLAELKRQATATEVLNQAPATLVMLSNVLARHDRAAAVTLLRRAQQRYPAHFWLNHQLALQLDNLVPARRDEAIGFYRAAVALRPDSPGAHFNLGLAFKRKGWLDEASAAFLQAIRCKPDYAEAHHTLGDILSDKGLLEQAIASYRKAIVLKPNYADTHNNLGNALRDKGKMDEAIACYRKAIALDPRYSPAHNGLGLALYGKGKVDEAIACYRKAIDLGPKGPPAHVNLGTALKNQGKLEEAVACFKKALELDPKYSPAHNGLGLALTAQGKVEEAIACLRKAIEFDPKNAQAHANLGNALRGKGQLDEAIECQRQAIALDPKYANAHYNLGSALKDKGKVDEAIECYKKAIELVPKYTEAHDGLGVVLCDVKRDYDGAIACFHQAIDLDPKYAKAYCNLGVALSGKGKKDEAIECYQRAIALDPKLANARLCLGLALRDKGKVEEAIECFKKAIDLDPKGFAAHLNLGTALGKQGKLEEAIACFRKALEIDPKYAHAHSDLGVALRNQGKVDEAVACFKKAIDLDPKYALAYCNLGTALRDKGQVDEGIACYKKAIALDPKLALAHFELGGALRGKGQLNEAIACYREAIRYRKDFAEAHYTLANALQARGLGDDAIAAYRQAIRLKRGFAPGHYNLGNALFAKGRLNDAITEYREAIRIDKDYAEAHCNLGHALRRQGEFRKALEQLRRGHEIGSRRPRWPFPSAQWVRQCEREVDLDGRLPGFLAGKTPPANPDEGIALAELCTLKRLNRATVRFYEKAFAAQPRLADAHRYNAACAAALAGCGKGKDTDKLDGKERARLRRQALDWLRADLAAYRQRLDKGPGNARSLVVKTMQHWQLDADFGGVRGPEALAKLPDSERQPWQDLWDGVAETLARGQGKK
jgi:tetratricopeptide (TPR) repeat protein